MYTTLFLFVGLAVAHMVSTTMARECKDDPLLKDECKLMRESFGDKVCKTKYHHVKRMMSNHCRATCGLCKGKNRNRAYAPPIPCHRSMHGCCWDGVTARRDASGSNCPVCVNRHRLLCHEFRWMCIGKKALNDYIKFSCPITCGYCVPTRYAKAKAAPSLVDIYSRSILKLRNAHRRMGRRAWRRRPRV